MTEISSRQNPEIKALAGLLGSRKDREETGLFVVEGVKMSVDALSANLHITKAFFTQTALQKYPQQCAEILQKAQQAFCLSDSLSDRLGDTKTPQGVFVVCKVPQSQPIDTSCDKRYIMLSSLQDPGNVGTIIRTACALGLDGVILSSDCPDIYSPKVLRSTMGGVFTLPVWVCQDLQKTIKDMRSGGAKVAAAALSPEALPIAEGGLCDVSCAVIGNEGRGLSQEIISACDSAIILPMSSPGQSLNAAMAATIFMWEMIKTK